MGWCLSPKFHLNLALFVPLTIYWLKWGLANTVLLLLIQLIMSIIITMNIYYLGFSHGTGQEFWTVFLKFEYKLLISLKYFFFSVVLWWVFVFFQVLRGCHCCWSANQTIFHEPSTFTNRTIKKKKKTSYVKKNFFWHSWLYSMDSDLNLHSLVDPLTLYCCRSFVTILCF